MLFVKCETGGTYMIKRIVSFAAAAVTAVTMCISASAETSNVEIDCSEAKKASNFGKSLAISSETFELGRITENSQIVMTYEILEQKEEDLSKSLISLSVQALSDPDNPFADEKGGVWVDVQPKNYDETTATFYYEDIFKAYGSKDFSKVSHIYVTAPTTAIIKVNSMIITDCNDSVPETTTTTAEPESVPEEETTTTAAETTTVAETTTTQPESTAQSTTESSSSSNILFVVIGVVAGVALAVAIIFIIISKKSDKAFDTTTGKFIDKKKMK